MSVSLFKIKKWTKMIMGKSSYHVNQTEGLCYSCDQIEGYYNNLTEKITRFGLEGDDIPITRHDTGPEIYFSIAIFQYGLAAYDLWLLNKEESMLRKFWNCVKWAVENQQEDGSWITFATHNPEEPYSAMAQGEGSSLLIRAYKISDNDEYLEQARKAIDFLLLPKDKGGVAEYHEKGIFLYEFTFKPLVLNGWIFASWGLLDFAKASGDKKIWEAWNCTARSIASTLDEFDSGYWSYYNKSGAMTSPFYHNLHLAQLKVMYELTGIEKYKIVAERWGKYQSSRFNKLRSFIVKATQKLLER